MLHHTEKKVGKYKHISGTHHLNKVIAIDQSPIGRTPRSNPSTYIKLFDDIRALFSQLPESQASGFASGRFSFNLKEGSCNHCRGMGMIRLDMDFVEDVWDTCPHCKGKRFNPNTLLVLYKQKNIYDILQMKVEEAQDFFQNIPHIAHKLSLLQQVGLGYITLGQPSTTLSGGEAQRIKLARELIRPCSKHTLYILDEPTTGLHFHDIKKLINILQHLVDKGNSILVIEHNMDLVKTVDWVIELGPGGGKEGGTIIATGTPESIEKCSTPTGKALKRKAHHSLSLPPCTTAQPLSAIYAVGCRQNNLKHLSLSIPHNKISVCTGPSGSGKSSFAFATIYAEGQRRYIDSLSPYARQFVKQMAKPKAEEITGLFPSIAIEQKRYVGSSRSTIGTVTEVHDFLRLLFAHIGTAYCPETGEKIETISKEFVLNQLMQLPENTRLYILSPIQTTHQKSIEEIQEIFTKKGFLHLRLNGKYYRLDEPIPYQYTRKNALYLVVDRIVIHPKVEKRLFEAIEHATNLSQNSFLVATQEKDILYNLAFAVPKTGKSYPPITPHTFSFNAEEGMCPTCLGLGFEYGANLLHYDEIMTLSPAYLMHNLWKETSSKTAQTLFLSFLEKEKIDPYTPLYQLPTNHLQIMLNGSSKPIDYHEMQYRWIGLHTLLEKIGKMGVPKIKNSFMSLLEQKPCHNCLGERLNPLARHVRIGEMTLGKLSTLPLSQVFSFCKTIKIDVTLKEVLEQLKNRLALLCHIGLDYLSLSRTTSTLSGGEIQRVHLAAQLGSGLTGCLYILDEPTMGLHPHNNERLNQTLKNLKDLGNTLLLVEHDPLTINIADHIFDFGPKAGPQGGELIAQGSLSQIKNHPISLTGAYLSQKKSIPYPQERRTSSTSLSIKNANKHNIKNLSIDIPTKLLVCITGVSGSGKSTLIQDILSKGLSMHLSTRSKEDAIEFEGTTISGLSPFNKLITIDQHFIGQTKRSDVSTYSGIGPYLRHFFSLLPQSVALGLKPKHFSYNHTQGMCRSCLGLGYRSIQLQFLPSVKIQCDTCQGYRLNPLTLKVAYKEKHFGQLLNLTVKEAAILLPQIPKMQKICNALIVTGLGHLLLGQNIPSLSGGEGGRIRLARELIQNNQGHTLYLFDEPTIGLHSYDIAKLLPIFHTLVDKGNSVIIIEHNLDIIKNADYLIDLGPDAGNRGGRIVATGTPEKVAKHSTSYTAKYLAHNLNL